MIYLIQLPPVAISFSSDQIYIYFLTYFLFTVLPLREDLKRGVYLYGNYEETINSALEGFQVFQNGNRNRHVAETAMNRESSRSHGVFTLMIQSKVYWRKCLDPCLKSLYLISDL